MHGRGFRPAAGVERRACGLDRTLDVFLSAFGDLRKANAIDGTDTAEGFAGSRIDILAVDERLGTDRQCLGFGFPIGTGQGFAHKVLLSVCG